MGGSLFLCIVFEKGDNVRLLDEPGQGIVISTNNNLVEVEIDGMVISFRKNQLVKVEFDDLVSPNIEEAEKIAKDKLRSIEAKAKLTHLKAQKNVTYELDLHIQELLDRYEHMTNAQILEHQMSCCKRFLKEARQKKWRKVILIHGVGEGVLRAEIRHWLDKLEYVVYHDAPYRTYGYGATEVLLRG